MSSATFAPLSQPLAGAHAIEASAGTGKTYAITLLWLRLLIEERVPVERILVSTFTKAATAELSERLLRAIDEARAALAETDPEQGPTAPIPTMVAQALRADPDRDLAKELERARSDFDLAPVSTLHGFCQTLIARHGLELGCDSAVELTDDCSDLLDPLVDDVLMRHAETAPLPPERARGMAARLASEPGVSEAAIQAPTAAMDGDAARTVLRQLADMRLEAEERVPGMKMRGKPEKILEHMDALLAGAKAKPLAKGTVDALDKAWPELAHTIAEAAHAREALRSICIRDILQTVRRTFPASKSEQGLRSFDDLLLVVREGLNHPSGERLAVAIRNRFEAVIIDECQDSDAIQIDVFRRLFLDAAQAQAAAPTRSFIVIGDPKQSIYRFRGADLASYRSLVAGCRQAPDMRTNWRSDPSLVTAINRLYAERPQFAGGSDRQPIRYVPVQAAATEDRIVEVGSQRPAGLNGLWSDRDDRRSAQADLARQSAEEIQRLLVSDVRLQDRHGATMRRLQADDIAVLADTGQQLALVRRELSARGIAAQQGGRGMGSVFASPEATDLVIWLEALAAAEEGGGGLLGRLLALAATPLVGVDARECQQLADDAERQAAMADSCRREAASLRRHGPLVTLLRRIGEAGHPQRILAGIDGERRLTNWRHLATLLSSEWAAGLRSASELRLHLARRIADGEDGDEQLMRLETDRPAVQLVTIHGSKGLEYPIVVCPFLWSVASHTAAKARKHGCAVVRRPEETLVDVGSPELDRHLDEELQQEQEEHERRLYVALTRARHRCYVGLARVPDSTGGHRNGSHRSALAELLRLAEDQEPAAWRATLDTAMPLRADQRPTADATAGADESSSSALTAPPVVEPWRCAIHRTSSFSALSRGHEHHHVVRDIDSLQQHSDAQSDPELIRERGEGLLANLGSGSQLGDRMHDLLEQIIDKRLLPADVVDERADQAPQWRAALETILATPIGPLDGSLAQRAQASMCEMHFVLPSETITPRALSQALLADPLISGDQQRRAWAEAVADWPFSRMRGFLQGYIDLTVAHQDRWFILDYKTNRLPDYSAATCEAVMIGSSYLLQARLYQLALHRHLRRTLADYDPARHLGGPCYLFLRGFPTAGVWHEPADPAGINALDALFAEALA